MTTKLARVLPAATPRLTSSMQQHEIDNQRKNLTFQVEIVLQGYWQADLSDAMRAAVLADYADELQDWPIDQIRWALRNWRSNNPNKKPNPAHISAILKQQRGQAIAKKMKAKRTDAPVRTEPRCSKEAAEQIMENAGFRPKAFG